MTVLTVREVIAQLEQLDPDLPVTVRCCTGSGRHPVTGHYKGATAVTVVGSTDDFDADLFDEEDDDDD